MSFEQELRLHGLMPKAIVPDGRIRRCRTEAKPTKENGWYLLRPDGSGVYGDWTTGSSEPLGHYQGEITKVDPSRFEAMRKKREQDKRAAILAARAWWQGCQPVKERPAYLERKGLTLVGSSGLRTRAGKLIAPVIGRRGLISIQRIDDNGEKRFWPGAPVRGGSVTLDRPGAALTVFCEGLATGLAVYQTVKLARVVVTFFADNIAPCVHALQPSGAVVIAADNDWRTQDKRGHNPGVEKAQSIADEIGCGVAYPEGIDGTDWADWLIEIGDRAGHQMQQKLLAASKYVMRC